MCPQAVQVKIVLLSVRSVAAIHGQSALLCSGYFELSHPPGIFSGLRSLRQCVPPGLGQQNQRADSSVTRLSDVLFVLAASAEVLHMRSPRPGGWSRSLLSRLWCNDAPATSCHSIFFVLFKNSFHMPVPTKPKGIAVDVTQFVSSFHRSGFGLVVALGWCADEPMQVRYRFSIRETSSHATRQGTLLHSRLSLLSHFWLILGPEKSGTGAREMIS